MYSENENKNTDNEQIPAKGEQVLLEDGSFVIGDGIHPVSQLPKPKILNG